MRLKRKIDNSVHPNDLNPAYGDWDSQSSLQSLLSLHLITYIYPFPFLMSSRLTDAAPAMSMRTTAGSRLTVQDIDDQSRERIGVAVHHLVPTTRIRNVLMAKVHEDDIIDTVVITTQTKSWKKASVCLKKRTRTLSGIMKRQTVP